MADITNNQASDAPGATVSHRSSRKRRRVVLALVLLLVIAGALAFALWPRDSRPARDPNAALGQLEGKTAEERQAELDRIVQEGMFSISIASSVDFATGQSEGELRIENTPNNRYLMQVVLTRNDTGEEIYTSGIIEPNHYIQTVKLSTPLPAGNYPCTATFTALDQNTEAEVGRAAAEIEVRVLA